MIDNTAHVLRVDRVYRGGAVLAVGSVGLSVALMGLGLWLALLPLAFWTGWVQLSSP
jgi:hypothetical protein